MESNRTRYIVSGLLGWGWVVFVGALLVLVLWGANQLALADVIPRISTWQLGLWQAVILVLLLLPCALCWYVWRKSLAGKIAATWVLAIGYAFWLLPVQLIGYTRAQEAALAQLVLTVLFGIGLTRWQKRDRTMPKRGGRAWAVLLGLLLAIPWLLRGALGSPLDTALNLAVAVAFGWVASRLLTRGWLQHWDSARNARKHWLIISLVWSVQIFIMAIGIGAHGQQVWLALLLSTTGILAAAVLQWGQGNQYNARNLWILTAIATAAALLTVDPDEQFIILSEMEIIATLLYSMAIAGLLSLVIFFYKKIAAPKEPRTARILLGATLVVGCLAAGSYFLVGQPGFFGERYFVILKEQADLTSVRAVPDYAQRRTLAYQLLTSTAQQTQAPLIAQLQQWGQPYSQFYLVNALEVPANPLLKWWLLQQPAVDRVIESPQLRPLADPPMQVTERKTITIGTKPTPTANAAESNLTWGLTMIQADRVQNELGIRGEGILVGQSDSGVEGSHSELNDSFRANLGWYDPWYHTTEPTDWGGHGTHTTGTAVGNTVGVAPDAQWIACVNLARNLGNPALYTRCLEFVFAPFPPDSDPLKDGNPTLGAHVLNNSWGCPEEMEGCDAESLEPAVRALTAAGVFVVASAGNSGPSCSSITDPIATYADSFTVGAIDSDGNLTSFSSRGPVAGKTMLKPDILAPGADIYSSFPGGGYENNAGTSMAGPHVVGVVALMWSANPNLIGQIEATAQILRDTAQPYHGTDESACGSPSGEEGSYTTGAGVVDAYAAVKAALDWKP